MAHTSKGKRLPPDIHEDQGKAIYSIVCIDEENRRYTLWFTIDLAGIQPLLNALILAEVTKRKLRGTPFTVHIRRLGDGREGLEP